MYVKKEDFTYNEIAKMLGWSNPNKVSRRIPELIKEGKVKVKEVRKMNNWLKVIVIFIEGINEGGLMFKMVKNESNQ